MLIEPFLFNLKTTLCMCVHICREVCMYHDVHVEVRGQLKKLVLSFPLNASQGLNSGCQIWWGAPLPTGLSLHLDRVFCFGAFVLFCDRSYVSLADWPGWIQLTKPCLLCFLGAMVKGMCHHKQLAGLCYILCCLHHYSLF